MAVHEINHPLVKHKVGLLRHKDIKVQDFRTIVAEIGVLLTYEATRNLNSNSATIESWAGHTEVQKISNQKITVVPILRAGLGMLDGVLQMLPGAGVSVVGFARNEDTLEAEKYYAKLVDDIQYKTAIVIDPMLATGGTLEATIDLLKAAGCTDIKGIFLVAAPEGLARIEAKHPDVEIFVAAVDDHLNEQGYILPGLGDAGDKIFGTL